MTKSFVIKTPHITTPYYQEDLLSFKNEWNAFKKAVWTQLPAFEKNLQKYNL